MVQTLFVLLTSVYTPERWCVNGCARRVARKFIGPVQRAAIALELTLPAVAASVAARMQLQLLHEPQFERMRQKLMPRIDTDLGNKLTALHRFGIECKHRP